MYKGYRKRFREPHNVWRKEILEMSKVSVRVNRMKNRLDSISGLDGDYVNEQLDYIERVLNIYVDKIDKYANEDEVNGTIF